MNSRGFTLLEMILVLVILYLPKGIWDPRRIRSFFHRGAKPGVA